MYSDWENAFRMKSDPRFSLYISEDRNQVTIIKLFLTTMSRSPWRLSGMLFTRLSLIGLCPKFPRVCHQVRDALQLINHFSRSINNNNLDQGDYQITAHGTRDIEISPRNKRYLCYQPGRLFNEAERNTRLDCFFWHDAILPKVFRRKSWWLETPPTMSSKWVSILSLQSLPVDSEARHVARWQLSPSQDTIWG